MGKGVIVSSLGDAAYNVRILKDVDRVDAAKGKCSDGISAASEAMAQAEQAETNARALITAIGEQLDAAIVAAKGSSSDTTVLALQKKQNEAADKLEAAQHDLAQAKLKKTTYEKELATYNGINGEEPREMWCADATDDMVAGAEVGTIEINQETTSILVAPGGEASDDILQPGMANDALGTFYNWGILPGVQRHRPTYRVGTIKEIDASTDKVMVCLDDARSSAQNIKINKDGTPCDVQKDGPAGFVDFCKSNPNHPACTANGSTKQSYSADLKATLDEINQRINGSNTYAYDSNQYGKLEHWSEMRQYGDTGDCEDFALTKYRACLLAGIPASSLKIATGKATNGQGHAWLEVQTDQGNVALDLNTQAATFSDELPYSARAVQADGTNWSGKGLLLEDVPVKYMDCNAAAFREGDRVVVHLKDSSWSTPEVIGFEEKPQQCGDILCIYYDGTEMKARKIFLTKDGLQVKDAVRATKYHAVPNFIDHSTYMKTFSKKITIDGKPFYLMASPAKKKSFSFGSIYDYLYLRSEYANYEYFYIYNPRTGMTFDIPLQSYGISTDFSTWNYGTGRFFCNRITTDPTNRTRILDVTFCSIDFAVGENDSVVFTNKKEDVLLAERFITSDSFLPTMVYDLKFGYVSPSGVFEMTRALMGNRAYSIGGEEAGTVTVTYDINSSTLTINGNQSDWVPDGNVAVCVDSQKFGLDRHYGRRESGTIHFGDIDVPCPRYTKIKTIRLPMSTEAKTLCAHWFEEYDGTTFISASDITVKTTYETLSIPQTSDVYGMSHIERVNGDVFQSLLVMDLIKKEVTDMFVYYNGKRIDADLASKIGVSKSNIIGFSHIPRQ